MWLVPDKDKKVERKGFGNRPMPWAQSNPMLLMIAAWKMKEKEKNGKDKTN
jgi:hypothetical protein